MCVPVASDAEPHPVVLGDDVLDGLVPVGEALEGHREQRLEGVATGLFEDVVDVVLGHQLLEDVHLPVVVGLHEPAYERLV